MMPVPSHILKNYEIIQKLEIKHSIGDNKKLLYILQNKMNENTTICEKN